MNQQDLTHDEAQSRYELHVGGELAGQVQYRREGDFIVFTHTEVRPPHEGKGHGQRLAAFALDDVKRRGLKAVPQCSFIAGYIERHPREYASLLVQ